MVGRRDGWQPIGGANLTGTSFRHTGLTVGTTYFYTIRAVNAAGETSDWLSTLRTATVARLSTPALTAAAAGGAVRLSWGAVQGAVRYELMAWWDEETGWQRIGGANLTGTSYTHTDVTVGTKYRYTIRAVNAAGEESAWLQQYVTVTATAAGLLTPALTAAATEGGVTLTWGTVRGAVRYELMTWWDAGTGWQPIGGANLTGTSYTHTVVTAGTKYYYTIRAVNAVGELSTWLRQYASATAVQPR